MKRRSRKKLPYKVDVRNKEAYQIVMSRFSPKINDFNALVLCVGEGLVRLGKVTTETVLLADMDYDPDLNKTVGLYEETFPAISSFLDKMSWGGKEKALSIIIGAAVKIINDNEEGELTLMISVGSADYEEMGAFSLPNPESTVSTQSVLQESKTVEVLKPVVVEQEPELEVDSDMLNDLAGDFDLDFMEEFEVADEFQS